MGVTAGIGTDHVDLGIVAGRGVTGTEVAFCDSISGAERVVMLNIALVHNYSPPHQTILDGGGNISDCGQRAYDVEGVTIGTVASGRGGLAVPRRLYPFNGDLCHVDRHRLPESAKKELNSTYYGDGDLASVKKMGQHCDVSTLNCSLHPGTEHTLDADMLSSLKRGACIVNPARGKPGVREDGAAALEGKQLAR